MYKLTDRISVIIIYKNKKTIYFIDITEEKIRTINIKYSTWKKKKLVRRALKK